MDLRESSVAVLPVISLKLLHERDYEESAKLLKACQTHGFLHLDLRDCGTILEDWKYVISAMDGFFDQELELKMGDDCQSDTWGYEPCGTSTGVNKGEPDGYESFKIARDEILPGGQVRRQFGRDHVQLFRRFINGANGALMAVCEGLSDALNLSPGSRFADFHRFDQPSLSTLAMFRYPKQEPDSQGSGHNKHTDLGSLTFLLSEQWGLQILSPDTGNWAFVEPTSLHAVINIGDSLRFLSNLALKSAVHRVVQTESMKTRHRYSVAYFLRAENDLEFVDSEGQKFCAKAWHDTKFDTFRQSHAEQELSSFLTGGMEKNDHLIL